MKDLKNFKFKKLDINKKLPMKMPKEVQIKHSLPDNKGLRNIFNISKGNITSKNHVVLRTLSPQKKYMAGNGKLRETYGTMPRFKNGRIAHSEMRSFFSNAGRIGERRMRQQKGLKPWGDSDGDGLINMLDCNPRNKRQKGPGLDDIVGGANHDAEEEIKEEQDQDMEVTLDVPDRDIDDIQPEPEQEMSRMDKLKGFLAGQKNISRAQKEKRDDAELRAEQRAIRAEERARQERLVRSKRKEIRSRKTEAQKAGMAVGAVGGAFSTIGSAAQAGKGYGVQQSALAGRPVYGSGAAKIMSFLGKPVETYAQPQPTAQQAQADPQQGVVSPYSKRRVSYVRGPYKK